MLTSEELDDVVLICNSSGGTVITGVVDRAPERIRQVVYLDAFVPHDSQSTFDLITPERRAAMEGLVRSEGFGWLLPRSPTRSHSPRCSSRPLLDRSKPAGEPAPDPI